MKNISLPLATMLLLFTSLTVGCKKDKEPDRDKFLGTYGVVENCPTFGTSNYDITITSSASAENAVIVNNFAGLPSLNVTGNVSGSNLTIPLQTVTVNGSAVSINGSGTLSGLSLTLTYTFSISGSGETCSMTCTKR